jgi:hypothetical protein
VLIGDDLPELGPNLVATLARLDVDNLTNHENEVINVTSFKY